jgi:hypothetical protein
MAKITNEEAREVLGWYSLARNRKDWGNCTAVMALAMIRLRESAEAGYPFRALDEFNRRIPRSLVGRDWAVQSNGIDGSLKYKLTGRGEKALEVFSELRRRGDRMCPACGEREKHVYGSGKSAGYCLPCVKRIDKERREKCGYQKKPGICPMCGEREKHITPSGRVRSYCKPCRAKRAKKYRKRKQKRLNWKLDIGLPLPCIRCGKNQRHRHGKTVYDYCYSCFREYMNDYHYRKMWKKHFEEGA